MGPMPPQGAPAPQPQGQPQGAPGGGGAAELLSKLHQGLGLLTKVAASAGPEAQEAVAGLLKQFEAVAGQLSGGGQPAPAPQPMRGNAPMEAGANPNARPMP